MKHHLRHDKTCLNCGHTVDDRFCSHCGQENIEPKQSFGHLLQHFVGDVTHYDSKFFVTLKDLLFKPGFLTKEYIAGRRSRYLDPVRTYIFISVVFFLTLFLKKGPEQAGEDEGGSAVYANLVRRHIADSLKESVKSQGAASAMDSIRTVAIQSIAASLDSAIVKDSTESITANFGDGGVQFLLVEKRYNNVAEYDSVQNTLAPDKRDKGFMRWMLRTNINLKSRYGSRSQVVLAENFQHSVPKIMFVLLPLFALFVYWFHSRKKYYYAQHVIFSIHFHSFMFVLLFVFTLLSLLLPHIGASYIPVLLSMLLLFIYLVVALKNTYHQSLMPAIFKTAVIGLMYIISLVICIIGLVFINFFTA